MSHAIVGRIFWKEARVQRAFWYWILGLGLFIQLLPAILGQAYYRTAIDIHWFQSVNVVMACCFAVGSTAIAFAGETENRTKSLFQRLPVRSMDLLVGKLGWSILGTYALLLTLALTANLFGGTQSPSNARLLPGLNTFNARLDDFWVSLLMPIPFVVVGVFCSLGFREVLTTVAVAGAATAVLLGTIGGGEHWIVPAVIMGGMLVGDSLLVPYWVRDSLTVPLSSRLRFPTRARSVPGNSTLSVRSSVAWRRAAGSLVWKERRQATPFAAMMLVMGGVLLVVLHMLREQSPRAFEEGWSGFVRVFLPAFPLPFGIAAARTDRRDGAYRLLARIGVAPNRYWLTKHSVWLGLALAAVLCLLGFDQFLLGLFPTPGFSPKTLWQLAELTAIETFDPPAGFATTLGTVVFDVLLLYALGQLLSLSIPSTMTSLVLGLIGWIGLAIFWMLTAHFEVPFWWTVGLLPAVFLLAGWVRARDWLVDRNSLAAWGYVAACVVVPLVGICCGVATFRVVQIPAVSLPLEFTRPQSPAADVRRLKQSLFVDALAALTSRPPQEDRAARSTVDDWEHFDPETRAWVDENAPARKLALEGAQQAPGAFPDLWSTRVREKGRVVVERSLADRVSDLAILLLDSARKLESEGKLEEAFENYVALARLGDDLSRLSRGPHRPFGPGPWAPNWTMALDAMDRWAAHPKQTTELIKRAIGFFQHLQQDAPLLSPHILEDWRTEREMFLSLVWKGNNPHPETRTVAEMGIVRWCLPWELLRLQRVQDAMFSRDLDEMQLVERELHDRGFVDASLITTNAYGKRPFGWVQGTLQPPTDSPDAFQWDSAAEWRVNQAARTSLHFLVWAAADYRREHHKLPAALSELVPTYFAALPIDPWTGRPFLYEPQGVPALLNVAGQGWHANQPFVASAGASECRIFVNEFLSGAVVPVRVVTSQGIDVNASRQSEMLDFPAPAVAIPSIESPTSKFRRNPEPTKPTGKPSTVPAGKPPAKPVDKLLAKPSQRPPAEKAPTKK
jgi:hypothetical protein